MSADAAATSAGAGRAPSVAAQVATRLTERGETLAVAESSTGGLIMSLLSDIPGASAWLRGGVVAYANEPKCEILGVGAMTLADYGVVSAETALDMARGVQQVFGATWALGETGIAGPRGTRRSAKTTGLTCLALVGSPGGERLERTERYQVPDLDDDDRVAIKRAFAAAALALLLAALPAGRASGGD